MAHPLLVASGTVDDDRRRDRHRRHDGRARRRRPEPLLAAAAGLAVWLIAGATSSAPMSGRFAPQPTSGAASVVGNPAGASPPGALGFTLPPASAPTPPTTHEAFCKDLPATADAARAQTPPQARSMHSVEAPATAEPAEAEQASPVQARGPLLSEYLRALDQVLQSSADPAGETATARPHDGAIPANPY